MKPLIGTADNGTRGELVSPLHTGTVGIRRRGEELEVAWFGPRSATQESAPATLDGVAIAITAVRFRLLGEKPVPGATWSFQATAAILGED